MIRHIFYSFHYNEDSWRASQVRNIRDIDGNKPAHDNAWEAVKRGGDAAIQHWIKGQMKGRTCVAVLVGANTANRPWINYEIAEGWRQNMGIFGVYINGLSDRSGKTSHKGGNPFGFVKLTDGPPFSSIVKCYDPTVLGDSKATYANIAKNMEAWIEEAIATRKCYS